MSSSPQHTGAGPSREGTATDQSLSPCYESKPGAPPHTRFSLFEVVLENLDPSVITLDSLKVYFRSEASCGGNLDEDRCSFDEVTGEAIITFIDADVTRRVLRRKEHMIGSMNVTIKAGKEQPIPVQNNKCLVIYKQHEIDKDDLTLLIKAKWKHTFPGIKIPGFDIEFNADNSAALVTFAQPVHNMAKLKEKISGKLLGGKVSAKLVNRTHSIMVENLPRNIDNDYLSLLFDSLDCPAYRIEQVKHDNTAIVHLKATEYVDTVCDMANHGELNLKKTALTCWPYLQEFHAVKAVGSPRQTLKFGETYVVYFGNSPPDDVTSFVKEMFAGCAVKLVPGHENRYVHVSVHPACGHDHLGVHKPRGYNGPVLVMQQPPTAVEFAVKITAEWILYYSKLSDCFQERILDPLVKEFGPISLKRKSYVVVCPPDKAQKLHVFLEEELRKALLRYHNLSGENEEHAKTGTSQFDVSSHYHANTPLATQSDKLKLCLHIWNYLNKHLSDNLVNLRSKYTCQIVPKHHDNNYVMIAITAQKHHIDALMRDFLQLVDTLAAEFIKVDLNSPNLSTDINKLRAKYIGVEIMILQNKSSLLIAGPKVPVHKIKQIAREAFPAMQS